MEDGLASKSSMLVDELRKFSTFGHIGAIRAMVSGGCIDTLCGPLTILSSTSTSTQGSKQRKIVYCLPSWQ